MKKTAVSGLLAVILVFAALLSGCKGEGIFASIAVSEKIVDGSLPDGVRASEVFNTSGSDFAFFSSGPRLFVKNITTGSNWSTVSLPGGYETVQSIAGSNNTIVLALSKGYGSSYETALYYFPGAASTPAYTKVTGADFLGTDSGYQTLGVFCPNPAGIDFYIDVRNWSGTHGEGSGTLQDSNFYSITNANLAVGWGSATSLATLTGRYITDGAFDGATYRFTAVNDDATSGILIDETGATIGTTPADLGPMTDIEYLANAGAFIAGSRTDSALYVGGTVGDNWYTVSGVGPDETHVSFADVTGAGTNTVLVGRDTLSGEGGYIEINTGGAAPIADGSWSVQTNSFADIVQYDSSPLPDVSITDFSKISGFLYASTRGEGLWRLDDSAAGNAWTDE